MSDDGQLGLLRQRHLIPKNAMLHIARRMIVEIIEANFAPRDDFGMLRQPGQFIQMLLRDFFRFVWMNPHEAKEVTQQHLDELARLAKHPKVIAWGEIGLDYFYDHSPRDVQHCVFRDQMALAQQAKLPIITHCRDAWSDCLNMIEEHWRPTGLGGILHCFTSTLEDARRGIEMGFLISFAGNSTYPKTQNLRDVAKALPLENIVIEPDATHLAPKPRRDSRYK